MMNQEEEYELLKQMKSEKTRQAAFTLIMSAYREAIYWHIRRLVVDHEEAQDLLQETFIKAYYGLPKFKGESSLKTWLYRIATNECIRSFRKSKLDTESYSDDNVLSNRLTASAAPDATEIEVELQKAILSLPEKQRIVFNLRYYDEMSYEQIAEITATSVGTLKTNYHYASEKIKKIMLNHLIC